MRRTPALPLGLQFLYPRQTVKGQAAKMREERTIVLLCGYRFVVGVSTEAHKEALEREAPELTIVVTGCSR
ncbi:DUF6310 domain-containing protein [Corallococcus exiguus]|uniref:DUF6310 domain-containing protein n=1 Tax=Corallococcus exiguus TaxID=83462 RepID=UPI00111F8218|nr:DUF6310 domain-containing protein [Corallococcus exiguus]TNV62251.1 hypothetical protein FH620_18710 [Corallococcus exiguus]